MERRKRTDIGLRGVLVVRRRTETCIKEKKIEASKVRTYGRNLLSCDGDDKGADDLFEVIGV